MALNASTPWHRETFDRFLYERLPQLLAARLPLTDYHAESVGPNACRVTLRLSGSTGEIEAVYADIPQPDEEGAFNLDGRQVVVLPMASQDELDAAEIACAGEQLYDFIAARLGDAPADLPWDAALVRAWLPLDAWVTEFLAHAGQELQQTNWLDRYTHLRRLFLPYRKRVLTPGHFGRTCPIETPEGPNIGKYLVIAVGATVRDGRLIVLDDRPEATLGLCASMIPFLEHNDPTRPLMGTNMMRQWMQPPDAEPALVQTGNEPDSPDFWCGRNLLTAFVSWGVDTHEDAVVISESCAKRLNYPTPVEPGDKLSNRFGAKGVVSRILPDAAMPHLEDGTHVELVYSFTGLISRMNFGQIREALMSRIARAEGIPAVVPPFHAPSEAELRARMASAGLPEDGMAQLTLGRGGKKLERRSTVGWVYWGRLYHLARGKMRANVTPPGEQETRVWESNEFHQQLYMDGTFSQRMGEREYVILRDEAAFETIREQFNTRSEARPDAETLAARVAAGPVVQAGPPSPLFADLTRRLAVAGIWAELGVEGQDSPQRTQRDTGESKDTRTDFKVGRQLTFRFAPPEGEALTLAQPIPHPWLREQSLTQIGAFPEVTEYAALAEANIRLERMVANNAPDSLQKKAFAELENRAQAFFETLLPQASVRFEARVLFGGRAVIAPGGGLQIDQAALPEEIAWTLFGPLVSRELGSTQEVQQRSKRASRTLDAAMARSWILLHRAPTLSPTAFLAFRPVRDPNRVVRLHPCLNNLMDADYDGDQIAIFLPITEAGQQEAGERLTVAAHLTRDPAILRGMTAWHAGRFGLASLSLRPEGKKEIEDILGLPVETPEGFVTGNTLLAALQTLLQRDGTERLFTALDSLQRRGFEATKETGASMSPFIGATVPRPPAPPTDDLDAWARYAEEIQEQMAARTDYADDDIGAQLLSIKSGARGLLRHLSWFAGVPGIFTDIDGKPVVVRHNLCDGMTPPEFFAVAVGAREGQYRMMQEYEQIALGAPAGSGPRGFSVLARAMRAPHPGIVFARAAANGETDPLREIDTRLFVGLPAQPSERR